MGIATAILIGTIALATLSLLGFLAHAAIGAEQRVGEQRERAALAEGQVALANHNIGDANTATKTAVDAEHVQEARRIALEKELADEAADSTRTDLDELRAARAAEQALSRPSGGTGAGGAVK